MRLAFGGALILVGLLLAALAAFMTFLVWAHHMYTVAVSPRAILLIGAGVALLVGCTTTGVWVIISRRWRAGASSTKVGAGRGR